MSPMPQSTTGGHPLFEPYKMGPLELPNRFVMTPLTSMRAGDPHRAPRALHAEYYAPRAGAGLIIGEATAISPDGPLADMRNTAVDGVPVDHSDYPALERVSQGAS